jgi:hypothetical protein
MRRRVTINSWSTHGISRAFRARKVGSEDCQDRKPRMKSVESGEPQFRELKPHDGLAASGGLREMRRLRNQSAAVPPEPLVSTFELPSPVAFPHRWPTVIYHGRVLHLERAPT